MFWLIVILLVLFSYWMMCIGGKAKEEELARIQYENEMREKAKREEYERYKNNVSSTKEYKIVFDILLKDIMEAYDKKKAETYLDYRFRELRIEKSDCIFYEYDGFTFSKPQEISSIFRDGLEKVVPDGVSLESYVPYPNDPYSNLRVIIRDINAKKI